MRGKFEIDSGAAKPEIYCNCILLSKIDQCQPKSNPSQTRVNYQNMISPKHMPPIPQHHHTVNPVAETGILKSKQLTYKNKGKTPTKQGDDPPWPSIQQPHQNLKMEVMKKPQILILAGQNHVLVTLGAHIHVRSTSKETTIVNAQNRAFWMGLTSCLIMLHIVTFLQKIDLEENINNQLHLNLD
ncbi:hypothetical protein H5410_057536 [Solanum commersonii]|uniref:Uncharacterized protein n=1 Tax=Solanum commersonii TaxID=4109 RepID=A0A9J5WPA7_SOLCO|nr:hypothetical protein H5410_057536 [Solanum commersonii]